MPSYKLLVPRTKASRAKKPGGGEDFRKKFWDEIIDEENIEHYRRVYSRRSGAVRRASAQIVAHSDVQEHKLYAEVTLDEDTTSKSSSPSKIWDEAGIDIVGAKDQFTLLLSGSAESFKKLKAIVEKSSFELARDGADGYRRKDKNIARELYAMSAFKDKSTEVDGRLSRAILSLVDSNFDGRVGCIIETYSDRLLTEYDTLYALLQSTFPNATLKQRNRALFINNLSFFAELTIAEIKSMLSDEKFNFINKIRGIPHIVSQRCVPGTNLSHITLLPSITSETVAIIDSGIHNTFLNPLRVHHMNELEAHQTPDQDHGTFVASRVLFGSDVFNQSSTTSSLLPLAKVLDVQVLYLDGIDSKVDLDVLKTAISKVVSRHTDIAIFNLSINYEHHVDDDDISELTEFLDHTAREKDVIFVCSVGNNEIYTSFPYLRIFKQNEAIIAAPSDAINVISVGSTSGIADVNTICKTPNYPSPFTRVGGIRGDMKKPEFVSDGGNIRTDPTNNYDVPHMNASVNSFGVEGINNAGLHKDIGTSFSAPLITRECVYLLDYIKKTNLADVIDLENNRLNLIKAMLIHSTSRTPQAIIADSQLKRAYGFGQPDHKLAIEDNENQITLVYADKINFSDNKQAVQIKLPRYLLDKKVEFVLTCVYNPPVDKNYPSEYKMVHLDATLRLIVPEIKEDGSMGTKPISLVPTQSWEDYRHDCHSVIHYKKARQHMPTELIEVLIQLSPTKPYASKILGREDRETQSYSFMLTVIDKSESGSIRQEIMALNELEELIENEIEVEVAN